LVGLSLSIGQSTSIAWTVAPRNVVAINTASVPGMAELSGLAYIGALGGSTHEVFAIQDSGDQLVRISIDLATNGALNAAAATTTKTLTPGHDFEGIAIGPNGSVLVAEEDTPAIRRYDPVSGAVAASLTMPAVFGSRRTNIGFESLTRAPDGITYWTANEEALTVDGPASTTTQGTTVRLQRFGYDSAGTVTLGPQYAYPVAPIHSGPALSQSRSGLVDLVALPDGTLLALERSLGFLQYESRIYHVTFAGATDVSQPPYHLGLIGQSYSLATKTLLWSGQVGGGSGQNLEGLALGPQLPGGNWSLLGVVDNGGGSDPLSGNTLVSFSLAPTSPGDFNGNGAVDAADYVIWRDGLGTLFTLSDFNFWRSHFGQIAGNGTSADVNGTAIPEPMTALMFVTCTPWVVRRFCTRPRNRSRNEQPNTLNRVPMVG